MGPRRYTGYAQLEASFITKLLRSWQARNAAHATASRYPPPRMPYRTISSNVTSRADGKLNANALHASV